MSPRFKGQNDCVLLFLGWVAPLQLRLLMSELDDHPGCYPESSFRKALISNLICACPRETAMAPLSHLCGLHVCVPQASSAPSISSVARCGLVQGTAVLWVGGSVKPMLSHPLFNNEEGKDWEWVQMYLFLFFFICQFIDRTSRHLNNVSVRSSLVNVCMILNFQN